MKPRCDRCGSEDLEINEMIFKNNTHHWQARCKCNRVFYINHGVMINIRKQELFPTPTSISYQYRSDEEAKKMDRKYREEQSIFSFLPV